MNVSDVSEQDGENLNTYGAAPSGYTGATDRESGEYHYKSGYTQRLYSDAHYVPADESTAPPKYYTPPPEKPPKETSPRRGKGGSGLRVLCACMLFLILGTMAGALFMGKRMELRLMDMEQRLNAAEASLLEVGELSEKALAASARSGASALSRLPGEISPSAIYERACREVVGITTEVTYTNFFGRTSSSAVTGSGFIVSEDGYILTNFHVIEYAYQYDYKITVMLHDGTRYTASIVGVEEGSDIAVLKIDAAGLTPVTMGDSNGIAVGDELYAVGNPLGELEFTMTFGRVSALDRIINAGENGEEVNMFQFDAAVNSGNSGGPAYNARGEVIGIVTSKYSSSGVEGLGFAIPMNDAAEIAGDLITKGYVTGKAYLGVQLDQRYTSVYSRYYGLPNGAYISYVERGSCAEKAGVQPGDIVTAIGSIPIGSYTDVSSALRHFTAGDESEIEVYRSGETRKLAIVFDEAKPAEAAKAG